MDHLLNMFKQELQIEADAINAVANRLDNSITRAFQLLYECKGKIVVTGMGKAGIIARKVSATLASTGSTSIFLHAAEGIHGDLGMLEEGDVVIAISYSGNTQELIAILPYIKFIHVPLIALTGNLRSSLAEHADVVIDCAVPAEAEPFGLVPTASTTVALAVGDALAVALLRKHDFQVQDFARFHPGGTIGKKLLLTVGDLMHKEDELPLVEENKPLAEAIVEMTSKTLGCTNVVDGHGILVGILTDGDLRRLLLKGSPDVLHLSAAEAMTKNPKRLTPNQLAIEALTLMEQYKITMLPIVDNEQKPIGLLHMHDLIKAGVVG